MIAAHPPVRVPWQSSGCATPCEGEVRDAYPAIRTGFVGVVSTRATPAFQPLDDSACPTDPRPIMTTHRLTRPRLLTMSAIFRRSPGERPAAGNKSVLQAFWLGLKNRPSCGKMPVKTFGIPAAEQPGSRINLLGFQDSPRRSANIFPASRVNLLYEETTLPPCPPRNP